MSITLFELENQFADCFNELVSETPVFITDQPLTPDNVQAYADSRIISTFIDSHLTADILETLPDIELIATRSTGFDHIDLDYCNSRQISVCNVPNYGPDSVAEHAFGLLLTLTRKLESALCETRHGRFSIRHLRGMELFGKTIGIIGTGNIGSSTARIAHGFGMHILGYDRIVNDDLCSTYGLEYVTLDKLLQSSDVISIHLPANTETQNLLAIDEFRQIKPGAILINTARGEVVDTFCLLDALISGQLTAAGLDVLTDESMLRDTNTLPSNHAATRILCANHKLMNLPNVIVTPHNAFNTHAAVKRITEITITNINRFLAGKPVNRVNTPDLQS